MIIMLLLFCNKVTSTCVEFAFYFGHSDMQRDLQQQKSVVSQNFNHKMVLELSKSGNVRRSVVYCATCTMDNELPLERLYTHCYYSKF